LFTNYLDVAGRLQVAGNLAVWLYSYLAEGKDEFRHKASELAS